MKTVHVVILAILIPFCAYAKRDSVQSTQLSKRVEVLEEKNLELINNADETMSQINTMTSKVDSIENVLEFYQYKIDSIKANLATTNATTNKLGADITDAKTQALKDKNELSDNINSKTQIGVIGIVIIFIVLLVLVITYFILKKKISTSSSSITAIRNTQQKIKETQKQLQEENVKLDGKLVEILERQIESQAGIKTDVLDDDNEIDHSLAIKVADEITRIEINLSRMDSSVKGYKQLSKAVERIKNNFLAQGYEIVDMLGKPYNNGMRVIADFVVNEELKEGEQIITGITKPQINYNGEMIQAAQITVSQNI